MFNGLALNPAYAGSLNLFVGTFIHRKQWINVKGAPTSQILTVHNSFLSNQIGVGLMVTKDRVGVHEETALYTSYAYKIKTSAGILALGLSGGFDNRRADFSQLSVLNDNDPLLTATSTKLSPNFGTGIYFANPILYVGVSVPYILENKLYQAESTVTNSKESRYYYGTAGLVLDINQNIKLAPSVLVRAQEQNRLGWDFNAMVIFDEIAYAGISYRNGDAIVVVAQMILNENFRVGYSYDATTSALSNHSKGSHEVMLIYRRKFKNWKKDQGCPVYF
jgi:type IX secretion system PorP/SprF family membrane protein